MKETIDEKGIYTPQETTDLLKISDSTLRRLIKRGMLRAVKIGGQYRVLGREILRLVDPSLPSKVKKTVKDVMNKLDE